ncbi:MAG: phosphatidate cytidylyltransferase [Oligoflexia bacterium]|nr:phosphatidate cytidylyltransferase [Oligoflexia bacterium]
MNELSARIATGVILSLAVAALLFFSDNCMGSISLVLVVVLITCRCAYEWVGFAYSSFRPFPFMLCLLPITFELLTGLGNHGLCGYEWRVPRGFGASCIGLLVALSFCAGSIFYRKRDDITAIQSEIARNFPALVHIGMGSSALLGLATLGNAATLLAWLLVVVCVNDIAAFFGGRSLGKRKLAPAISPKKTVEGSACGLIAGTLVGVSLSNWAPYCNTFSAALLAIFVILAAQLADLIESYLKRCCGVKDSAALLPGHGGVFDRIDALLGAAPVLYSWIFWNSWI